MTETALRYTRGNFYDVGAPGPSYTGLNYSGGDFYASTYDLTGALVADLTTVSPSGSFSTGDTQRAKAIWTDPAGLTGDHSVLIHTESGFYLSTTILVWDVDAGTITAEDQMLTVNRATPYQGVNWVDGWIYFLDVPDSGTGTCYLKKVRSDLSTGLATVSSLVITSAISLGATTYWSNTDVFCRQSSGNYCRFPLNGDAASEGVTPTFVGVATGNVARPVPQQSAGLIWNTDTDKATKWADSGTTESTMWPGGWSYTSALATIHPTSDGLETIVYRAINSGSAAELLRSDWAPSGGIPATITIDAMGVLGTVPYAVVPRF